MRDVMKQQTNVQAWPVVALGDCTRIVSGTTPSRSCPAQLLDFLHECCKGVRYPFAQRAQKLGNSLTTVMPQKCGIHTIAGTAGDGVCFGAMTAGLACFWVLWAAKVHGMDPAWDCGMTVRGVV